MLTPLQTWNDKCYIYNYIMSSAAEEKLCPAGENNLQHNRPVKENLHNKMSICQLKMGQMDFQQAGRVLTNNMQ